MTARIEICIDDVAGLDACRDGGADRVELCSALDLGGLTPSPGLITAAAQLSIPVRAMIRPRAGDFHFSEAEIGVMLSEIAAVRAAGLEGVVLGASTRDDQLDTETLKRLIAAAGSLGKTLHRVVDTFHDPLTAVDQAIELGFDCILTSGGALRAEGGTDVIAAMVARAAGRIEIMAGSGVKSGNAAEIRRLTGVTWLHSSCAGTTPNTGETVRLGFGPNDRRFTDPERIHALRAALA
jgi:copper homeostasis protein